MKLTELKISIGKTINLGNYESLRLDVEMAAKIDLNDDLESCAESLRRDAKLQLNRMIKIETEKRKMEDYY
jgi:hypothetical protein